MKIILPIIILLNFNLFASKRIIQIEPIKMEKKDKFLQNQLVKMAIRHIISQNKYQLALGDIIKSKDLDIDVLEIKVKNKKKVPAIEVRLFEMKRETLQIKEVIQKKPELLLQEAENMFGRIFRAKVSK